MSKLGKALLLGILLSSLAAKGNVLEQINNEIKGGPAFEKYRKYAMDFAERFTKEYSGEKQRPFSNAIIEKDYQEFAKLMAEAVKKSNISMQDVSDFHAKVQAEQQRKKITPFSNLEKENDYQRYKATIKSTRSILSNR